MDLKDIQSKQEEFIQSRKWKRFSASQVFTHLIEELGEIGSHILYSEEYKVKGAGHEGMDSDIEEEFAQVFNLFLQLAIQLDIDLEDAWKNEHQRMLKRFDKEIWNDLASENDNTESN